MAQMTILVSVDVVEKALEVVRNVGQSDADASRLRSIDPDTWGAFGEVWNSIEQALTSVRRYGRATAEALFQAAVVKAEEMIAAAGAIATELQHELMKKLSVFMQSWTDFALSFVRAGITVGDKAYVLRSVRLSQKIVVGASLKGSLTDAFELASSGELSIESEYAGALV
jgi:nitrogen regulatory protein PII-like uncharacterized protein